jgi:DNA repair protein RecO (recombination protein O)
MSQINTDECFLLHQRPYGETSIISEVFTKKNGKMSLIAKGAKKPKSKFFGYLVPFYKLNITYSGRSELKTLTNIDRDLSDFNNTLSKKSYSLLYINELLIKLLPKDASHLELFNLYQSFLEEVSKKKEIEIVLRHFELDLLDMLGYGLDYDYDIDNNNPIVPNAFYTFISEKGFKESDKAGLSGEHIINIKNRNLEEVPRKSLKEITTKAIRLCLDGKELSSREIFKSIKK